MRRAANGIAKHCAPALSHVATRLRTARQRGKTTMVQRRCTWRSWASRMGLYGCCSSEARMCVGARASVDVALGAQPPVHRAQPNGSSAAAVSPLHHAAGAGNLEIVARLLEAGADVNRLAPSGTPLHWAAGGGHEETVGVLVRAGADVNAISEEVRHDAALDLAHENDHCCSGAAVADRCRPLPSRVPRTRCTPRCRPQGMTATIAAAAKGCTAAVRCLIDAGADLSVASNEPAGQLTVLHLAAETGVLAMVEAVLATAEGRASANATNSDGLRPIQCAAATGHEDVVRLLLPHTDLSAIPAHDGGDGATGAETGASEQDAVARLMWQERHRWMQIKQGMAGELRALCITAGSLTARAAACSPSRSCASAGPHPPAAAHAGSSHSSSTGGGHAAQGEGQPHVRLEAVRGGGRGVHARTGAACGRCHVRAAAARARAGPGELTMSRSRAGSGATEARAGWRWETLSRRWWTR